MATRMLIDARHSEETRVAVLKGNRIEEFDFESAEHKQIKGNIYLAKVTRVEPSLQAAFVDFGGNRHGFLAFNEIHPDYYQIPKDDRDALLAEEAEAAAEEARLRAEEEEEGNVPGDEYDADEESSEGLAEDLAEDGMEEIDTSEKDKVATIEEGHVDGDDDDSDEDSDEGDEESDDGDGDDDDKPKGRRSRGRGGRRGRTGKGGRRQGGGKGRSRAKEVDEVRAKRMALRRRYKIQDVIQRRQVLLVQVVKEERGNKGAALTTYLSLAGRYTVLMPNSSHGGGISRKISSAQDRKRLKQVVGDLSLPKTMGLIVRTAGLSRTKTEIKRDFDYLARLWDEIRNNTLGSSAPALIHSDSDLIKRAIRDIYNREIEEVIVEGEDGYKSAKSFMKMLMPSHARRVKAYSDPVPLFQRYGAEDQLRAMYDPVVQLKSGGYLVINPTEALVSIDINSGRSTKEHGIEQTATATNVEAAREIARQLRLRDMAGLVVIDFIDMEYNSNVRKVERAMKDSLKSDRARIQVGRISGFGLMEMSRQRLRTGVLEATTRECPHCDGTGLVRTASSAGLSALRLIEDEAARGKGTTISLSASTEAAVYLLNSKRSDLAEIEDRYNVSVEVVPEGEDEGAKMAVGSSGPKPSQAPKFEPIVDDEDDDDDIPEDNYDDEDDRPKKKRRRRGGRGRNKNRSDNDDDGSSNANDNQSRPEDSESDDEDDKPKKRRRRGGRGRRGGRNRNNGDQDGGQNGDTQNNDSQNSDGQNNDSQNSDGQNSDGQNGGQNDDVAANDTQNHGEVSEPVKEEAAIAGAPNDTADPAETAAAEEKPKRKPRKKAEPKPKKADAEAETENAEEKPKPKRKPRKKAEPKAAPKTDEATPADAKSDDAKAEEKPKAKRAPRKKAAPKAETAPKAKAAASPAKEEPAPAAEAEAQPTAKKRGGWWQRTFGE